MIATLGLRVGLVHAQADECGRPRSPSGPHRGKRDTGPLGDDSHAEGIDMPHKYKTILVPTDFSDVAQMALHYAVGFVAPNGRIILCHVVDDVPWTYGYVKLSLDTVGLRSKLAAGADRELRSIIPADSANSRIETCVLHGSPYGEIVRLARRELVDLVIMGTHGRSGFVRWLLGSVAEQVIRMSPSPVMVVREGGAGFEAA